MSLEKGATMSKINKHVIWGSVAALLLTGVFVSVLSFPLYSVSAQSGNGTIASGAGTTIIQGGTGSPSFVPVKTTIAFHAERSGAEVTGDFECLAFAPAVATGPGSGQFTVNAMYVSGQITGAVVAGDTATLTGISHITGLGAGSSVPFELVIRGGGPGATAVLTTKGSPTLTFHEILTEGSFHVSSDQ
jgi:hypothetical protein